MANKVINVDLEKEILDLLKCDGFLDAIPLSVLEEKLRKQTISYTHKELGSIIQNLLKDNRICVTSVWFTETGDIKGICIKLI
jgi:hypothetical protein